MSRRPLWILCLVPCCGGPAAADDGPVRIAARRPVSTAAAAASPRLPLPARSVPAAARHDIRTSGEVRPPVFPDVDLPADVPGGAVVRAAADKSPPPSP